jgi:hypothetical protein
MAVQIAAPLFLDILRPFFLLLGWEQVRSDPGNTRFPPLDFTYYPWSSSGTCFSAPPSYVRTDIVWPAIIAEAILLPWAWWF